MFGGGGTALLITNAPKIAAAAKMGVEACLANLALCGTRATIAAAEIGAGDAVGGAAIAVPVAVATSKGGKVVAEVIEDVVGARGTIKNGDLNVWHSTEKSDAVVNILDKGIDPNYLNPSSRFGKAFYVAEQPTTSIAEMNHYGVDPTTGIRFRIDLSQAKVLDLTDPAIAQQWGYSGGEKTLQMQKIGSDARASGYNAIRFNSERSAGGTNFAVLDNFNEVLKPQMVTPVKK